MNKTMAELAVDNAKVLSFENAERVTTKSMSFLYPDWELNDLVNNDVDYAFKRVCDGTVEIIYKDNSRACAVVDRYGRGGVAWVESGEMVGEKRLYNIK